VLQDVSSHLRILYRRFSNLLFLLTLFLSSCRYADTGVLSLAPLKHLAQSARVVSFEPRPQPPCAEPLLAQVEEGLAVASVEGESGVPSPPATAAAVEEERTAMEMAAAQASLEPRVGAGSGGADVVVVPSDEDSAPPLPAGDHDVISGGAFSHRRGARAFSYRGSSGAFFSRGRRNCRGGDGTGDTLVCGLPRHRGRRP
jgi:hypothetical protein